MSHTTAGPRRPTGADRQDERLNERESIRGAITGFVDRVRAGDLGAVPVIAGLIIIWVIFQALNSVFLSSANLVNLSIEMSPVGVIALGIVVVLLVGQIDLSVGSMSGLSAAVVAILFVNHGWPLVAAVLVAILTGTAVGFIYGAMFNRFGVPSFVATLAGLLALLGLQLESLGNAGAINIPFDSFLVKFASLLFVPKWLSYLIVVAAAAWPFLGRYRLARARGRAGLSARPIQLIAVQSLGLLVILGVVAFFLNRTRGVSWMFVFFVALTIAMNYALTRTKWGRSVFAVGGNAEAARRAGIKVQRIYLSAFVICSTLAAVGGILAAARLAAANNSTGTGDVNLDAIAAAVIGGTSLFGGRGSAYAALLGILVIQSISSGLTLLNLSSGLRFLITGVVLLLAVAIDSIARRSRASHGRA
ncbi:MAG: sugar ABC transporter permease [Mycobacteriales bacterium]